MEERQYLCWAFQLTPRTITASSARAAAERFARNARLCAGSFVNVLPVDQADRFEIGVVG